MAQTTHTNEEFSQVLTALLQERKKVQELEEQLLTLQEGRESDEGHEKVKSLFLLLKKKYAQALHALNDKEKRLHELERIQTQYEALKTTYSQTAKKAEIAEEEIHALRQQHTVLVGHLREAQDDGASIQEELNRVVIRLQELEVQCDTLEKENQELKSLRDEYEYLKIQAEASQLKADELAEKLSGSHEQGATIESLREERDQLADALTENCKRAEQLDKVVVFLRERNQEALNEITEQKETHANLAKEHAAHLLELQKSREEVESYKQQQHTAENQLKVALEQLETETRQLGLIQARLDGAVQKLQEAEELHHKYKTLIDEKEQSEKELQDLKASLEEREARIKIAQQHLGKKVKETNFLSERVEEQKIQIIELHNNIEAYKYKISDMQHTLDSQIQQEKRIEENLLDSLKTAEIQARRWEEKYFLMCDKWQQAEAYVRELKGLEEKFNQVNAVFASLGNILNTVPISPKILQESHQPLRYSLEEDSLSS